MLKNTKYKYKRKNYVSFGIEFKNAFVLVIGSSRSVTPSGNVGTDRVVHIRSADAFCARASEV